MEKEFVYIDGAVKMDRQRFITMIVAVLAGWVVAGAIFLIVADLKGWN